MKHMATMPRNVQEQGPSLDKYFPKFRRSVGNYEPSDTASHPRRLEPSTTAICKPQISPSVILPIATSVETFDSSAVNPSFVPFSQPL
jgi:hypothetical protein